MIEPPPLPSKPPELPEQKLEACAVAAVAPRLLFQNHYTWFIFLSAMDFMLTLVILAYGGVEVNAVAARIIQNHSFGGLFAFKLGMVLFIILLIEVIGRLRQETGLKVARMAILLTSFPVLAAAGQIMIVAGTSWLSIMSAR